VQSSVETSVQQHLARLVPESGAHRLGPLVTRHDRDLHRVSAKVSGVLFDCVDESPTDAFAASPLGDGEGHELDDTTRLEGVIGTDRRDDESVPDDTSRRLAGHEVGTTLTGERFFVERSA